MRMLPSAAAAYVCGPTQTGVAIGGGDRHTYHNVSDATTCCSLCGNSDDCKAWDLHTLPASANYHDCALYTSSDPSTYSNRSDSLAGVVTGASGCLSYSGGFWGTGHDNVAPTMHNVVGAPLCCAACRANSPKCKSWVWHSDDRTCWQHGSTTGFSLKSGAVGGVPSGPLPPVPATPGQYVEGFACRDADAAAKYKFCDGALPLEARLDDLVPRVAVRLLARCSLLTSAFTYF